MFFYSSEVHDDFERIRDRHPRSVSAASRLLQEVYERARREYSYAGPYIRGTNPQGREYAASIERYQYAFARRKAVEHLLRRHLAVEGRRGDALMVRLTRDGHLKALRTRIVLCTKKLPPGEVCVVLGFTV